MYTSIIIEVEFDFIKFFEKINVLKKTIHLESTLYEFIFTYSVFHIFEE